MGLGLAFRNFSLVAETPGAHLCRLVVSWILLSTVEHCSQSWSGQDVAEDLWPGDV